MTVKHMRIFVAVYQELNVTRASELLHMTQPAVTRSIRELENYYGIRLFERMNHRLFRTESGKELYAHALHLIESFDRLEKGMRNWDEFGILRIGGSITIGNFILPQVVSEYRRMHPNMRVKVTISNSESIRQAIRDNRIDLALLEGNVSSEYLAAELFTQDRLCLILSPDHPLCGAEKVSINDLDGYPLLLREKGSAGRAFLDHIFAFHGIQIEPMWESVSTQALVKAVASGLGISILPEQLVKQDIDNGTVKTRAIEEEAFLRKNYIVWHREKYITRAAREFMELCSRRGRNQTGQIQT